MKYIIWLVLIFIIIFVSYSAVSIILFSHLKISFYEQVPYIVNIGYIGSFISGATSFLSLILTIVALYYIRRTYNKDKKKEKIDDFERKFFILLENFIDFEKNNNYHDIIISISNLNLKDAKIKLKNHSYFFDQSIKNLYIILTLVNNKLYFSKKNDSLFYIEILKSYMSNNFLLILIVYCYELDDEKYNGSDLKKLLEKFEIFQKVSILNSNGIIFFPLICAYSYYFGSAFKNNIWLKYNGFLKEIYKYNSTEFVLPFINYALNKKIKHKNKHDRLYINKDDAQNNFEIIFRSSGCKGYEYFCLTAYQKSDFFFIDDHLDAEFSIMNSEDNYYLYMKLRYSKDFIDFDIPRSEITMQIYEEKNELILIVNEIEIVEDKTD